MRSCAGALVGAMLFGCAPCPRGVAPKPPRDARDALTFIAANLSRLESAPLWSRGVVSFRYRDAEGRRHSYVAHPATLIFFPPRCLRFDIKSSIAGSVARVGSNDERFWLWVEPEVSTMWWGEWADLTSGAGPTRDLPLPPDQLLDALMLRPLPRNLPDGPPPLMLSDGRAPRLLYLRSGPEGWPYVAQEVLLDPCPPYQPTGLIVRAPDGSPLMQVELRDYRRTGPDGPYTPRRYVIRWPRDEAELRLDVHEAALRPDQPPFSDFPADPPVRNVERLWPASGVEARRAPAPALLSGASGKAPCTGHS